MPPPPSQEQSLFQLFLFIKDDEQSLPVWEPSSPQLNMGTVLSWPGGQESGMDPFTCEEVSMLLFSRESWMDDHTHIKEETTGSHIDF